MLVQVNENNLKESTFLTEKETNYMDRIRFCLLQNFPKFFLVLSILIGCWNAGLIQFKHNIIYHFKLLAIVARFIDIKLTPLLELHIFKKSMIRLNSLFIDRIAFLRPSSQVTKKSNFISTILRQIRFTYRPKMMIRGFYIYVRNCPLPSVCDNVGTKSIQSEN